MDDKYDSITQHIMVLYSKPNIVIEISPCDIYLIDFEFHFINCN